MSFIVLLLKIIITGCSNGVSCIVDSICRYRITTGIVSILL